MILILGLLILNSVSAEELIPCEMHQIFTIDDVGVVNVEFNTTAKSHLYCHFCTGFSLLRDYNISDISAYSITENISLSVINETRDDRTHIYTGPWKPLESEPYLTSIGFSSYGLLRKHAPKKHRLYWSYGNSSYDLPLKYKFRINKKFQYSKEDSNCLGCNISQEGDYTIVSTEGIAKNGTYFNASIVFEDFKPPSLDISKRVISRMPISVGENIVIYIVVRNFGDKVARNITIAPSVLPELKLIEEDSLVISELNPGKSEPLHYSLETLTPIGKRYLGSDEVKFYDVWGGEHSMLSDNPEINVEGKKIMLPGLGISVAEENFWWYLFNFIFGYCVLFYASVFRKKDREKKYKAWAHTPFFDKSILSSLLAGLNLVVAITVLLILLSMYIMITELLGWKLDLSYLPEKETLYFFLILSIPTTAFLFDGYIKRIFYGLSERLSFDNNKFWSWFKRIFKVVYVGLVILLILKWLFWH